MKSAQFVQLGKPADVLAIKDIAIPTPSDGEVRIKVTMSNINPSDIMFVQGAYGISPRLPAVGGFEATGVVDAIGNGVALKIGQRVAFIAIGVWQEYVVVPYQGLIAIPDALNDEVACQLVVNPFTAFALLEESKLTAGDWLLITAGASAFGKFVVQLCQQRQINTICTVRRDEQKILLTALGATAVVNTEDANWVETVKQLTAKKGVNAVFDAVGGEVGGLTVDTLAYGGTLYAFGLLSLNPTPVNTGVMIFKNLQIKGFWLTTWLVTKSKDELMALTSAVISQLSTEQLRADIEATYALDQIHDAIIHAERPGKNGKILIDMR